MRAPVPALGLLLLIALPANATVLHVCPDGSGDYANLHAAVAAAQSGDEIELCDGVFTDLDNVDLVVGPKDLVIRSQHGRDATILDGGIIGGEFGEYQPHRAFLLDAGTSTTLQGLTLRNFWVHDEDGGAVFAPGASVRLQDVRIDRAPYRPHGADRGAGVFADGGTVYASGCEFIGNHAADYGGAISCGGGGSVELIGCHFSGCASCNWGGAADASGGSATDCVFEQGSGGYCDGSNPGGNQLRGVGTIVGCVFRDNHDIDCSCVFGATLVDGCLFEANDQEYGACLRGVSTVRNTVFAHNFTASGAADIVASGTVIEGCTFIGSRAAAGRWPGGAIIALGDVTVRSSTFVGIGHGAGLECRSPGIQVAIDRTIFAFADSPSPSVACTEIPLSLEVSCTDILGNGAGDWVECLTGMEGEDDNLSADPLFCGLAVEDLSIRSTSPCAPGHSECGLIGALPEGCGTTALMPSTWGQIKGQYR